MPPSWFQGSRAPEGVTEISLHGLQDLCPQGEHLIPGVLQPLPGGCSLGIGSFKIESCRPSPGLSEN